MHAEISVLSCISGDEDIAVQTKDFSILNLFFNLFEVYLEWFSKQRTDGSQMNCFPVPTSET